MLATFIVLYWTTQKGAILGFAVAMLAMFLSSPKRVMPIKLAVGIATLITVAAPVNSDPFLNATRSRHL